MKTELFSIRTSRVHRISGKVLSSSLNGAYSGKDKTMAALHPPNPEAVLYNVSSECVGESHRPV